jgi:hypothetical protein
VNERHSRRGNARPRRQLSHLDREHAQSSTRRGNDADGARGSYEHVIESRERCMPLREPEEMMTFTYQRRHRGKIKCVILDWAGTTMDSGCMAPAVVFIKVYEKAGADLHGRGAAAHGAYNRRISRGFEIRRCASADQDPRQA